MAAMAAWAGAAPGEEIVQEGFEARGPYFKPGGGDAVHKVLLHELTEQYRHGGQKSEHLRVQIEKGTYLHYVYDLPAAPINDDLTVSLWLKSNRPGVKVYCRAVLPRERDPRDPARNMTVLLPCEPYGSTQWKAILLLQPKKRLQEQQRLLNLKLKRDLNVAGAYVDQVVLNVLDGTGVVDVWIDDLEAGPVLESVRSGRPVPAVPTARPSPGAAPRRAIEAALAGKNLLLDGKPYFIRGIRSTGLPLSFLNQSGFNTIWLDENASPAKVAEASRLGLRVVPTLAASSDGGSLAERMRKFESGENVLAWDLGTNLDAARFTEVSRHARDLQGDGQRLLIADVWDGHRGYSRGLDGVLIGSHRWPLFTSLELPDYREWLVQRRNLSRASYSWSWVQSHLPEWLVRLAYPGQGAEGFAEPTGPLPEQIRLLAYITLAAGCRGLAFWSDRFLADSHQGRDRLLCLALLNSELKLLERLLLEANDAPEWVDTDNPNVKTALFRMSRTVLALPMWVGPGSQYVPGQAAASSVEVRIPAAPITGSAWEVTPGRIRPLKVERTSRGAVVRVPNFSLCSAVVLTSDMGEDGVIVRLQAEQQAQARMAAQWLQDQASAEMAKVERVQRLLAEAGQAVPSSDALLERARKALAEAERHRLDRNYSEEYTQAEVALRALRALMRSSWERAVRDLSVPTASPYAVSYFTLPRHWQFLDEVRASRPGANALSGGDFEVPVGQRQPGWVVQEAEPLDSVRQTVTRVSTGAHSGSQCVRLEVQPSDPRRPPVALERTFIALHSPAVKVPPGSLVRISAWLKVPAPITGSVDGALFYDSVGGEPLAVRLTKPMRWKQFTLYRRAPASGLVHATIALSGMGAVFVDDVRIEPLVPAAASR
jgi:hypothetical protein